MCFFFSDNTNDLLSINRKLDEMLYLLVKKPREEFTWQFPQGGVDGGETLVEVWIGFFFNYGIQSATGSGQVGETICNCNSLTCNTAYYCLASLMFSAELCIEFSCLYESHTITFYKPCIAS